MSLATSVLYLLSYVLDKATDGTVSQNVYLGQLVAQATRSAHRIMIFKSCGVSVANGRIGGEKQDSVALFVLCR